MKLKAKIDIIDRYPPKLPVIPSTPRSSPPKFIRYRLQSFSDKPPRVSRRVYPIRIRVKSIRNVRVVIIQRINPAMELADGSKAVVDPEVQAYVSSLVTAVCLNAFHPP